MRLVRYSLFLLRDCKLSLCSCGTSFAPQHAEIRLIVKVRTQGINGSAKPDSGSGQS
jgi:hypothetical protein